MVVDDQSCNSDGVDDVDDGFDEGVNVEVKGRFLGPSQVQHVLSNTLMRPESTMFMSKKAYWRMFSRSFTEGSVAVVGAGFPANALGREFHRGGHRNRTCRPRTVEPWGTTGEFHPIVDARHATVSGVYACGLLGPKEGNAPG